MILISHRGNVNGRNESLENTPSYIEEAISEGYQVKVDVWYIENRLYLGSDSPQWPIDIIWILTRKSKLWIHCKNIESLMYFKGCDFDINFFWLQDDTVTLTSTGNIFSYASEQLIDGGIVFLPEVCNGDVSRCLGVCSDFIKKHNRMIVFAVHGLTDRIQIALDQLNQFNTIDVLIVDTNSPSDNIKLFYDKNKSRYRFRLLYERIDEMCYETGAYIHSFKKYDIDRYYFFQDSVEFVNPYIFRDIDELLKKYNVVAVCPFSFVFDTIGQLNWVLSNVPELINSGVTFYLLDQDSGKCFAQFPNQIFGIFGSMFSIKRKDLLTLPENWLVYPKEKGQSMAMERQWPIMFLLKELSVTYLESDIAELLSNKNNRYIKKYFLGRQ